MSSVLNTQHTMYTITDTNIPTIQVISGGAYHNNLIYRPEKNTDFMQTGDVFRATFVHTNHNFDTNGRYLGGAVIQTSPLSEDAIRTDDKKILNPDMTVSNISPESFYQVQRPQKQSVLHKNRRLPSVMRHQNLQSQQNSYQMGD